jgi:tRNA threonylcarbamoyladenosine biosynthesis protein TsaE
MKSLEARNLDDLTFIASEVLTALDERKIIALHGEMGAGKTTFISYLAKSMGVTDEISSPTYGYVNEYESPYYGTIYHFDLYRLDSEEQAFDIGIEEYIYSDNICVIEWPEVIDSLLPENTMHLKIERQGDVRVFMFN